MSSLPPLFKARTLPQQGALSTSTKCVVPTSPPCTIFEVPGPQPINAAFIALETQHRSHGATLRVEIIDGATGATVASLPVVKLAPGCTTIGDLKAAVRLLMSSDVQSNTSEDHSTGSAQVSFFVEGDMLQLLDEVTQLPSYLVDAAQITGLLMRRNGHAARSSGDGNGDGDCALSTDHLFTFLHDSAADVAARSALFHAVAADAGHSMRACAESAAAAMDGESALVGVESNLRRYTFCALSVPCALCRGAMAVAETHVARRCYVDVPSSVDGGVVFPRFSDLAHRACCLRDLAGEKPLVGGARAPAPAATAEQEAAAAAALSAAGYTELFGSSDELLAAGREDAVLAAVLALWEQERRDGRSKAEAARAAACMARQREAMESVESAAATGALLDRLG